MGQSGNLGLNGRNARESWRGRDGPGRREQRSSGGASAAGAQGTLRRALQLLGICTAVLMPPPPTRRGIETRPPAPAAYSARRNASLLSPGSLLVNRRRIGEVPPRGQPAPHARGAHAPAGRPWPDTPRPPRLRLTAPPPPSWLPLPAGAPVRSRQRSSSGPPRPLEGSAVLASPARRPAFPGAA